MLAHDESLNVLVDALCFEHLLLCIRAFLGINLVETLVSEHLAELPLASAEVQDLGLLPAIVAVAPISCG